MVYRYAVSNFFATYLQIAPIRTYVLLTQLLMVQEMKLPCNHTKFCAFVSMSVPMISSLPSGNMDVLKRLPSECLKKVMWSYHQTRRRHDIWKKTSDLRRLEGVWFTTSWARLIYVVLKTSKLRHLEDAWFTTSGERLILDVMKTSDLHCLEGVQFTTSWGRL